MKKKIILIPENHTVTEFLRGKASQIFDGVTTEDKVVIVNKNSKPHNVIISYDRYCRLKKMGQIFRREKWHFVQKIKLEIRQELLWDLLILVVIM